MKRIAIIGMSCRLPGANSPEALWELVSRGVDAVKEVPPSRWPSADFYHEDPKRAGKMYTARGGFIEKLEDFDGNAFGISPREILHMDPQQRLMLELAWEALEDAGVPQQSLAGSATGVFFGFGVMEYALTQLRYPELIDAYTNTGYFPCIIANRVSYYFDLRGPSVSLDTACSSSLVAVHLACESLRNGECQLAMAGGVSLMVDPLTTVAFCKLSALSPNGRCKTFDAGADGYVRGEGGGVVLLKRFEDAIADGDRIYAVIMGEAVNQDGKSNGLTAPNRLSQEDVLRQAYRNAQYSPADVQYIEAHGTGTFLGDPIELTALGNIMREGREKGRPLLVGSLKTNIGHLEAAAGIAGLIKLAKCVEHQQIPPHLHFEVPNPHIPFDSLQLKVATELQSWPEHNGPAIAGISAFGFGGTNAHVVLGEHLAEGTSERGEMDEQAETAEGDPSLLLITARDPNALSELCKRYAEFLAKDTQELRFSEIANCAAHRRSHFQFRASIVANNCKSASEALSIYNTNALTQRASINPKIAFLFTGQGSQYVGMGRQLYQREAIFRNVIDRCDQQLRSPLKCSLREVMFEDESATPQLNQSALTQPAIFAIQWGLVELWKAWGVRPNLVLGHSIGELAGACTAGLLSWNSGLIFAAKRGALMQSLGEPGKMLAILDSRSATCDFLDRHALQLCISASNGPKNTVLSGSSFEIERAFSISKVERLAAIQLNVSHAFHSKVIEPILDGLLHEASNLEFTESTVPFISNLTGELVNAGSQLSPSYLKAHARSEVRFMQSIESLIDWRPDLCIEIGADSTLIAMLKKCAGGAELTCRPSLKGGQDAMQSMLDALGAAFAAGASINCEQVYGLKRRVVKLPTYPFQRKRYWESLPIGGATSAVPVESSPAQPLENNPQHSLLGSRADSAIKMFRSTVDANHPTWLAEHVIAGSTLFPGSASIEIAICAAASDRDYSNRDPIELSDIRFLQPVILSATSASHFECSVQQGVVTIASRESAVLGATQNPEMKWRNVASAKFNAQEASKCAVDPVEINSCLSACDRSVLSQSLYDSLAKVGLRYGAAFRRVAKVWFSPKVVWGEIRFEEVDRDSNFHFSPMVLDACFHVVAAAISANVDELRSCHVPVAIERVWLSRIVADRVYVRVQNVSWETESRSFVADFDIFLPDGQCIGSISKSRFAKYDVREPMSISEQNIAIWKPMWKPVEIVRCEQSGFGDHVTFVGNDRDLADSIRKKLAVAESEWTFESLANYRESNSDLKSKVATTEGQKRTVLISIEGETQVNDPKAVWENVLVQCKSLQEWLVTNAREKEIRQVVLLTQGATSIGENDNPTSLSSCCVAGWFRSVRLEMPQWRWEHIDLDLRQPKSEQVSLVAQWLHSTTDNFDVSFCDGVGYVRTVEKVENQSPLAEATDEHAIDHSLSFIKQGSLDYLQYVPSSRRLPGPDEVEIQVRSTGLNFRDVLNVLGLYPGDAGPLGGECAGFVSAVGDNVNHLHVGDPVVAISAGSFSSYTVAQASLVARKPPHLTFAEASCVPIASLTASIALKHFGDIKSNDRVLIHSAAGGVGLAAVHIARRVGAEVYATAGSNQKRELLRSLGVKHVADSRSTEFDQDIALALNDQRLDIVLNSLSAEFIPRSLNLLKPGGNFIEIGKIGTWSALEVAAKFPTVRYSQFDLAEWAKVDPVQLGQMLREELATYQISSYRPRITTFARGRAADAFRYMSQAKQIGKIAVVQPSNPPVPSEWLFSPDATYLVTGALGAIGRKLIDWMVKNGARHVEFLIRRPLRGDEQTLVEGWRRQQIQVNCHVVDATDLDAVCDLVAKIGHSSKPLRGVFHLAGELRDCAAVESPWQDYEAVLNSKSLIAWNLHQALRENDLQYFVLFSSIAALLGSPGQSNYSAANAFLDGLALLRQHEGLPALSIQWGPWAGKGMAEKFLSRGIQLGLGALEANNAWIILEDLLRSGAVHASVAEIDAQKLIRTMGPQFSSSLLKSMQLQNDVPNHKGLVTTFDQWAARIRNASKATRQEVIVEFLSTTARDILGLPSTTRLDIRQPLRELGLDSLMAVEMKNVLSAVFQVSMETTVLFDYPTIEALARLLNERAEVQNPIIENTGTMTDEAESEFAIEDIAVRLAKVLASMRHKDKLSS